MAEKADKKFLFDRDFGEQPRKTASKETPTPSPASALPHEAAGFDFLENEPPLEELQSNLHKAMEEMKVQDPNFQPPSPPASPQNVLSAVNKVDPLGFATGADDSPPQNTTTMAPSAPAVPKPDLPPPEPETPRLPLFTKEQLDEAVTQARQEGNLQGHREEQDSIAEKTHQIALKIEAAYPHLFEDKGAFQTVLTEEALSVVQAVYRKTLPVFAQKYGFAEIKKVLTDVFSMLTGEPRVVIKVTPTFEAETKKLLASLTETAAAKGEFVIRPDTSILPGDCKIEWEKGGIEKNRPLALKEIENIVLSHLKTLTPETPKKEPPHG